MPVCTSIYGSYSFVGYMVRRTFPPEAEEKTGSGMAPCLKCGKMLRNGYSIQCCQCSNWLHRDCANITIEEFNLLEKELKVENGKRYRCGACLPSTPNTARNTSLLKCLSTNDTLFEQIKNYFDDKFEIQMKQIKEENIKLIEAYQLKINYLEKELKNLSPLKDKVKELEIQVNKMSKLKNNANNIEKVQKLPRATASKSAEELILSDLSPPISSNDNMSQLDVNPSANSDMGDVRNDQRQDWIEVSHGRKRNKHNNNNAIVGTAKNVTSIQANPKKGFLFISRLQPNTDPKDIVAALRKDFPEVTCEKLVSKHPELYSSFKVTVNHYNLDAALKPSVWAEGVYVATFFRKSPQFPTRG
nr:unnamed protein product [Callosobruchus analis]